MTSTVALVDVILVGIALIKNACARGLEQNTNSFQTNLRFNCSQQLEFFSSLVRLVRSLFNSIGVVTNVFPKGMIHLRKVFVEATCNNRLAFVSRPLLELRLLP